MNALGLPSALLVLLLVVDDKPALKPADIDYEARLNDIAGKGITPEKNANVLLWKAFGPRPEGGNGMPAEYFQRLGIPEPPKEGDYFVGIEKFAREFLKLPPGSLTEVEDEQDSAAKRPWSGKDYPRVAAWLKVNEKPLLVVVEATNRTYYYNPLVAPREQKERGLLFGAKLPNVQRSRDLAKALAARAMFRIDEGKHNEAWQDILAVHRLGRLVGRGSTLVEALVGIAIDTIASNAELAYLERGNLTAKQVQDRLKDLQSLPARPSMADKMDTAERFTHLDILQFVRRDGVGQLEALADGRPRKPTNEELAILAKLDWEPAIANANKWFDRIAAAGRIPDRAARQKEIEKLERDLKELKQNARNQAELIAEVAVGYDPGKPLIRAIGDILLSMLLPAFQNVQLACDRAEQTERNLHIAFALAAYRADNGKYPAKLDDLAPKYLPTVPLDLFSGKPLIYKPDEKGYLLYSVGENGKDDDGQWRDDTPPGDDPRVRMPVPPLKKDQ